MEKIYSWLLSILGVVILTFLVELIMPEGKLVKYIKSVFAFITLLIIVSPLVGLKNVNFDLKEFFYNATIEVDEGYISSINNRKVEALQYSIIKTAENYGLKNINVQLTSQASENDFKIVKVVIFLDNLVIDENYEHINKYKLLKDIVQMYINIDEEEIVFYE